MRDSSLASAAVLAIVVALGAGIYMASRLAPATGQ